MSHFEKSKKLSANSGLYEFTNNYHHRLKTEWCPMEMCGVASCCPKISRQSIIYHRTIGMVPKYAGHVPGELYAIGRTFGNATIDARRFLALHKD